MSLNVSDQECNSGKKYGQKGTLCGPNKWSSAPSVPTPHFQRRF
jgi:hypothetical protein